MIERPNEPSKTMSDRVWYRDWECGWEAERAYWTRLGWVAYRGGCDLDARQCVEATWDELLDAIDIEES